MSAVPPQVSHPVSDADAIVVAEPAVHSDPAVVEPAPIAKPEVIVEVLPEGAPETVVEAAVVEAEIIEAEGVPVESSLNVSSEDSLQEISPAAIPLMAQQQLGLSQPRVLNPLNAPQATEVEAAMDGQVIEVETHPVNAKPDQP